MKTKTGEKADERSAPLRNVVFIAEILQVLL